MQYYLFFEIINKSLLWRIEYKIVTIYNHNQENSNKTYYDVQFIIYINNNLTEKYITSSLALNYIIYDIYINLPYFLISNFTNKSFIPTNNNNNILISNKLKIQLYNYQENTINKMIDIEQRKTNYKINYTYNINLNNYGNNNNINIIFDPISNVKVDEEKYFNLTSNGGILADEMGLGKTISCIGLISTHIPLPIDNFYKYSNKLSINKINSNTTLILCPSHLAKQWEYEIKRCNPNLKILLILTKNIYSKLKFSDFISIDIIITTHQFIINFKFYPTLYYRSCSASDFDQRNIYIRNYIHNNIIGKSETSIKNMINPIFEFFYFNRFILDEGHEIFGELINSLPLNKYMTKWINSIDANYNWYVSGTPFVNNASIINTARFIKLNFDDNIRNIHFDYSSNHFLNNVIKKNYIWDSILNNLCIRHKKEDVNNQINIHGYEEEIIWIKLTNIERQLYDNKASKASSYILQQLCCHALVDESNKKIYGNGEVDLSVMQDKLIEHHKKNYTYYSNKLNLLDNSKPEYHMLKKSYETLINESKYLLAIFEKLNNHEIINEEICSICMDNITNPSLTTCGHLFCYDCLKLCLNIKKLCPICKSNLNNKDIMIINKKDNEDNNNILLQKYGSKLGKLISIIKKLIIDDKSRIIIFSQWDEMLLLVSKTLYENKIDNCFIKGNVWSRTSAINKFKVGKDNCGNTTKIIMLSLKNAASGTNLSEATHIFFIEPINSPINEIKAIESQAIARCCRIGQLNKVKLIRILIKDTIEEDIYNNYYTQI
jgi:SNF2 family DNA or RNA helicase